MKNVFLARQRGMSLTGLIIILIVVGFIGLILAQVAPTYMEYRGVMKAISIARTAGSTVREVQQSFDKQCDTGYITAITSKDLEITKENGEFNISFAYDKKIPLVGPASILLEYKGSTQNSLAKKPKDLPL